MPDVLNWIARSCVAIEGESRDFLKNSLPDVFGERRVMEVGSLNQALRQLGLHDLFLDQLIEGIKIQEPPALRIALRLRRVLLEGCDLGLELLVE